MKIGNLRGILVTPDDPRFLEDQVEPKRQLLDLEALNVSQIRDRYIQRQKNFDTAPFDVEGRALRFFPGGYTIWSGYPGAGKTTLLRQLACHLMHKSKPVFVASLEEDPEDTFFNHAIVAMGTTDPQQAGLEWCVHHWQKCLRLWSSDVLPAPHGALLAVVRVLASQGVRHSIIDPLMCLDIGATDWEAQRLFANALKRTCKTSGAHVHLVAHPRKTISADQEPDMNDVGGSADLTRLADNILFARRSKNETISPEGNITPMKISILKQRHGNGSCGDISGWFNRNLKQYQSEQFNQQRTEYLPHEAYREAFGELL